MGLLYIVGTPRKGPWKAPVVVVLHTNCAGDIVSRSTLFDCFHHVYPRKGGLRSAASWLDKELTGVRDAQWNREEVKAFLAQSADRYHFGDFQAIDPALPPFEAAERVLQHLERRC